MRKKEVKKKKKTEKSSTHHRRHRFWLPAGKFYREPEAIVGGVRTKVSKELQWILPLLEKTHKILPRLQMPIAIRGYKPSLSRRMRTLGTSYYDDGVINIATHHQIWERSRGRAFRVKGLRRIPKVKILETLAHELAHLHIVEHNFEHAEMTKIIFRTFGIKKSCPHCYGTGSVEFPCNPH